MQNIKRWAVGTLAILWGLFLFVGLAPQPVAEAAPSKTLYLLGDSWTQQPFGLGTFDKILASRNLSESVRLENHAISGSTAAQWAADQNASLTNVTNAIKNDPLDAPVVYLTLGGNDLLAAFVGGPNDAAYTLVEAHIRTVITQVVATRDDVTVVIGGYDLTNPAASSGNNFLTCEALLKGVFDTTDPAVINPYILRLFDTLTAIAADFDNVHVVNTYGSLQGTPGQPDLSQWSPRELIADCIHPNSAGYDLHLKTVFDAKLAGLLMPPLERHIFLPTIIRSAP